MTKGIEIVARIAPGSAINHFIVSASMMYLSNEIGLNRLDIEIDWTGPMLKLTRVHGWNGCAKAGSCHS